MRPSPKYLLDSSALIALILKEAGGDQVLQVIDECAIHTVSLAETTSKLIQKGVPTELASGLITQMNIDVIPQLPAEQADACGQLHAATRKLGLALGDCICLGVSNSLGLTALTADRDWLKLNRRNLILESPFSVRCIRG